MPPNALSARLPSAAKTGHLSAPKAMATTPPPSTRSSKPPSSMTLTPRHISEPSSPASPIIRPSASANSFPGISSADSTVATGRLPLRILCGESFSSCFRDEHDHRARLDAVRVQHGNRGALVEPDRVVRRRQGRVDGPAPGAAQGRGRNPEGQRLPVGVEGDVDVTIDRPRTIDPPAVEREGERPALEAE